MQDLVSACGHFAPLSKKHSLKASFVLTRATPFSPGSAGMSHLHFP